MLVGASFLALLWLSIFAAGHDSFWARVAGWLAWVAVAAPFGRYYYLLFLVPAAYGLGLRVLACSSRRRYVWFAVLTTLSLSLLGARGHNPLYAIAAWATLGTHLVVELRSLRRSAGQVAKTNCV